MSYTATLAVTISSKDNTRGVNALSLRAIPDTTAGVGEPLGGSGNNPNSGDFRYYATGTAASVEGALTPAGTLWGIVNPTTTNGIQSAKLYGTSSGDSGVLIDASRPCFIGIGSTNITWAVPNAVSYELYNE